MSLTVKAYLGYFEKSKGDTEIRRFAVEEGVATNFEYLQKKVAQVFPNLQKSFGLYWKDQDEDYIAFSSDEELTEALGFVNDGIFKIYIKESKPKSQEDEPHNDVHPGVVCDGCEKPVRGFRYKCLVCPDYDLCGDCESKGLHTEHNMRKIPRPQLPPFWANLPRFFHGPPFPGMFHPPPHGGPGPHGGPPHHHPHGPPPPPPHEGCPPPDAPTGEEEGQEAGSPFMPPGACPPHMRKFMRRCWRRYWREMNGNPNKCKGKKGKKEKHQKNGEKPEKDGKGKDSSSGSSSDEADVSPSEDYLKNVGASVAAMLDPLGIDVEVDVEHKGRKCGMRGGRGRGWWGPWGGPWGRGQCHMRGGPHGGGRGRWRGQGAWANWAAGQGGPAAEETPANQDVEMEAQEANAEPAWNITEYIVEKEKVNETEAAATDAPMKEAPPKKADSPDKEWTFVGESEAAPQPAKEKSANSSGATPLYPRISDETLEQHISDAIAHMRTMGFDDDNGWLTRLMQAKNGNISMALDAIQLGKK